DLNRKLDRHIDRGRDRFVVLHIASTIPYLLSQMLKQLTPQDLTCRHVCYRINLENFPQSGFAVVLVAEPTMTAGEAEPRQRQPVGFLQPNGLVEVVPC